MQSRIEENWDKILIWMGVAFDISAIIIDTWVRNLVIYKSEGNTVFFCVDPKRGTYGVRYLYQRGYTECLQKAIQALLGVPDIKVVVTETPANEPVINESSTMETANQPKEMAEEMSADADDHHGFLPAETDIIDALGDRPIQLFVENEAQFAPYQPVTTVQEKPQETERDYKVKTGYISHIGGSKTMEKQVFELISHGVFRLCFDTRTTHGEEMERLLQESVEGDTIVINDCGQLIGYSYREKEMNRFQEAVILIRQIHRLGITLTILDRQWVIDSSEQGEAHYQTLVDELSRLSFETDVAGLLYDGKKALTDDEKKLVREWKEKDISYTDIVCACSESVRSTRNSVQYVHSILRKWGKLTDR